MPIAGYRLPDENAAQSENTWNQLRARLENEKRRIYREIASYPPPITACDAQFNYLLEERSWIRAELSRLNQLSTGTSEGDAAQSIAEFIESSRYIDDECTSSSEPTVERNLTP